jgi:hypothetical protein
VLEHPPQVIDDAATVAARSPASSPEHFRATVAADTPGSRGGWLPHPPRAEVPDDRARRGWSHAALAGGGGCAQHRYQRNHHPHLASSISAGLGGQTATHPVYVKRSNAPTALVPRGELTTMSTVIPESAPAGETAVITLSLATLKVAGTPPK